MAEQHGISLDKAEFLSVTLEGILYGFSLLMFGGTIWALLSQRYTQQVNRKMFAVACALFVCSTAHIVIHIIRVMEGLMLYRDTFPGGPAAFFADVSQWTFVTKSHLYTVQTLIGDGVILYRCYAVWQSKLVMILPILLWCSVGVTGIGTVYTISMIGHNGVFGGALTRWITSWWATALATTLTTTILLACRIWYVDRKSKRARGNQKSQLRPILHIVVDAGVVYSFTVLVALIFFEAQSNIQYVILDMVMPIISITFYMVIIRVGLANRANRSKGSVGYTSADQRDTVSAQFDRRRAVRIDMTKAAGAAECHKFDSYGQRSPMYVVESPGLGSGRLGENPHCAIASDAKICGVVDYDEDEAVPLGSKLPV